MERSIYTIIDANINRALEGLRVCEDASRFILKNTDISLKIKDLRHRIAAGADIFKGNILIASRDVNGDPIKFSDIPSELERNSVYDIVKKNLHRAMEATRSLEEYSKLLHNTSPFQEIRFSLYNLEREFLLYIDKINIVNKFNSALYAILDSSFIINNDYAQTALRLINGGASIIQLRMKNSSMRDLLNTAKEISPVCKDHDVLFIVNDYPEIAYLSGAGGVHLGQDDIPVPDARRVLPDGFIIGISTHSIEQAIAADPLNPDYIAIGPIFDTKSKNGNLIKGIGMSVIADVSSKVKPPVVCIGGLVPEKILDLKKSGAKCFAVISYLYQNEAIEDNCRMMISAIKDDD